jgi:hypothetical protein
MRDDIGRRHILASLLAATAATPLVANAGLQVGGPITLTEMDPNARAFWNALGTKVNKSGQAFGQPPPPADPGRAPIFFYAKDPGDSTKWIRANAISQSELLATDSQKNPHGDTNFKFRVNAVKFSTDDQNAVGKIENGSLRIDVGQAQSFGPSVGNLIWTAIGSIWPTVAGKLPATPAANFDPGTTWQTPSKVVPLPGGSGSLLWNFFVNKKPSILSQIIKTLQGALPTATIVAPLLGLPGYAVSAFAAFNKIFGAIPQTPTFLFQQQEWQDVVCTQAAAAANTLNPGGSVGLIDGKQYIAVPTSQADSFFSEISMKKYVLTNGRIVLPNDPIAETAAVKYFPNVTYATFGVSVKAGLS